MLVLSRKRDERIVIDGVIVVTILQIDNSRVRLGIEAPPEVEIHREEVLRRILAKLAAEAEPAAEDGQDAAS